MDKRCNRPDCYYHEGETCADGHVITSKCAHYNQANVEPEVTHQQDNDAARVPWSGSTLGLSDLVTLTSRTRRTLIGVLGSHDAGKTTLLLANYLLCLRGERLAGASFAGSWTLGAWESLAAWTRFNDATTQPGFPPHTPRSTERNPGLLHLALRRPDSSLRDVLLTDAPGEWFSKWAVNQNAQDAMGAKWTVDQSDGFIILADCQRLSGELRGAARRELRQLIERLAPFVGIRPVTLVWAKTDITSLDELKPGIRNAVQKTLVDLIPHAVEIETSVQKPSKFSDALATVLNDSWQPRLATPIIEPIIGHQPYSAFRGSHEKT